MVVAPRNKSVTTFHSCLHGMWVFRSTSVLACFTLTIPHFVQDLQLILLFHFFHFSLSDQWQLLFHIGKWKKSTFVFAWIQKENMSFALSYRMDLFYYRFVYMFYFSTGFSSKKHNETHSRRGPLNVHKTKKVYDFCV